MSNETTWTWKNLITPYKPCGKCTDGYIIDDTEAYECECHIKYIEDITYVAKLIMSNVINERSSLDNLNSIKNYSFSNYAGKDQNGNIKKLELFVKNFSSKYSAINLFFSGSPGTQKTTIAKFMISELVKKDVSCYYILANKLIETISDAQRNQDSSDIIQNILLKDFLVIDEMDEEKIITYSSGWQRKLIFPFLKERLESIGKSTLFISNKDIKSVGSYFEGAIQDLIEREIPQPMYFMDKFTSYRQKIDVSKLWDEE